ncbi:hypothetical protein Lepto7376_1931 [[Leptolyngbya] sp. PCC 7376]|uniref:hypothetical protein n=1 Tax=[Leptolyngbya] sp. PCC 7376 TaxID=111781 RepID=UPI00029ECCCD|nr:hypothetical protein [[Leptolyngbya] sp. PCC 7376]AFY38245.1 hypothetical protein Lepto7376_1931 [[Leptolyngbya] sp. PCC 7376]
MSFLSVFKSFIKSRTAVHALISISIVCTTGLLDYSLTQIALSRNQYWRSHISPAKVHEIEDVTVLDSSIQDPTQKRQLNRIKEIYNKIMFRRYVHSDVMALFYARYFATLYIISIGAVASSLSLLTISKSGWENASKYLSNVFIVSTGIVVLYGNLMVSLDYKRNITNNERLSISYSLIIEEILSYLATGQNKVGEEMEMSQFIHYIDNEISNVYEITLDFDDAKSLENYEKIQTTIDSSSSN